MRPLFKGAFYSFLSYKGAPIIQGRPLIKGAHYLRLYGTYCFLIFIFKSTYFKGRFEQFLKSCLLSIFFKSKNSKFVKQNDFVFFFLDVETLRKID